MGKVVSTGLIWFCFKPVLCSGVYTKQLMTDRDKARRVIKSTPGDKWIALQNTKH